MIYVLVKFWEKILFPILKGINNLFLAGDRVILNAIGDPPEISQETQEKILGFWDKNRSGIQNGALMAWRIISTSIVIMFLILAGIGIREALHIGEPSALTNPALQHTIPTVEPTPGSTVQSIKIDQTWLTTKQSLDLEQHPGINLVEVNQDGTVRYSASQSANFNGQSPWVKATPGQIEGLNLNRSSVVLTIDGHPIEIYTLQPFFFASDISNIPLNVYIVDEQGQVWMANASDVVVPLRDAHPRSHLSPDPELTPGI